MIKLFSDRLIISDYVIQDLENHHKLLSDAIIIYYLQDILTKNIEKTKDNLLKAINDQSSKERMEKIIKYATTSYKRSYVQYHLCFMENEYIIIYSKMIDNF